MSNKPAAPADLASLELDLANSFVPSWAKETDSMERMSRLAEKDGGGDRRGGFGKRRDDRGPRPGGNAGGGARSPRPADRAQRPAQRNEREGSSRGPRDDRSRFSRPEREARPEVLEGWNLQFIPDRHGVEGMAKQIKNTAKTYPLFDLAKLVLEKPERYLVEFKRGSETSTPLYQAKVDGSVWLSEAEAISHVLSHHMDTYYRKERVAVEAPKGAYPFVAVCGMSGVLLGPSNYHDYPSKILKLHAERFSNVPFDVFKSRIKMVKDEESIQKWKDEQSWKDEFYPVDPAAKKTAQPAIETKAVEETPAVEPAAEIPKTDAAVEISSDIQPEAVAEAPEAAPESEVPAVENTEAQSEEPAAEAAAAVEPAEKPKGLSLAEVEKHFRDNHLAKNVVLIRERVLVPGTIAINTSTQGAVRLVRQTWEELRRFPLPLAHTLSRNLTSKGLQIFKAHQNITYVSVARPKYLDRQATPVSDALVGILDYLEANPTAPREEQFKALVALRPEVPNGSESQRESAVAADLFWLLREGHVIDFARRGLEAARKPQVQGPRKKDVKETKAKSDAAKPETEDVPVIETVSPQAEKAEISAPATAVAVEKADAKPVDPVSS